MTFIIKQAERTAVAGYLFGKTACQYVTTVTNILRVAALYKTLSPPSRFVTQQSFCRVQETFFKKPHLPLGERKTCLQVCIFDRFACQKCFCVTLDKSNRTEDKQVYEIGAFLLSNKNEF